VSNKAIRITPGPSTVFFRLPRPAYTILTFGNTIEEGATAPLVISFDFIIWLHMRIQNLNVKDREQAVIAANFMEAAGAEVFSIMESHSEGQWIVWCKVAKDSDYYKYTDPFYAKLREMEKERRAAERKAKRPKPD
jgi:hypothetical protein